MKKRFYIGIDVGGTKIAAGLVSPQGAILLRNKTATPRKSQPKKTVEVIADAAAELIEEAGLGKNDIAGIGIGIPGLVDTRKGRVIVTPNMNLSGINLSQKLKKRLKTKIFLGNDVNVGLLGEKWKGAAKKAHDVVGLFLGTGLGGGIIVRDRLVTGFQGAAAEIGHMIVDPRGPRCTCGNKGCLEAYVGRWAIERDIRTELARKKKTSFTDFFRGKKRIKSKTLRQALKKKDPLVTAVMEKAARMLGLACVSLRHIFDPEVIVLGGGVIEACSDFILPYVKKAVARDPFFSHLKDCRVVASKLEDDAIILGGAALAQQELGREPAEEKFPSLILKGAKSIFIGTKEYDEDIYIRVDGKVKKRNRNLAMKKYGTLLKLGSVELKKVCKKKPQILVIGTGTRGLLRLTPDAKAYLKKQGITVKILSTSKAVMFYNLLRDKKKSLFLHLA